MVQAAAYVAGTFHLDPIMILDADYMDWQIRLQAAIYFNTESNRQAQAQQK
jgi:hypothetical protein